MGSCVFPMGHLPNAVWNPRLPSRCARLFHRYRCEWMHWQLRWAPNSPRHRVMPLSLVCRSEGSDASKGVEDTVMIDTTVSPRMAGQRVYSAAKNKEWEKVEVRRPLLEDIF
jgi:hypothetical protein